MRYIEVPRGREIRNPDGGVHEDRPQLAGGQLDAREMRRMQRIGTMEGTMTRFHVLGGATGRKGKST